MFRSCFLLFLLPGALAAPQSAPQATVTAPPSGYTAVLPLWPAGAVPLAQGSSEGDVPKLFTYRAAGAGPHPAVIVMPGGGYTHLVMGKEGDVAARWLNAHGVSAFVLEYRLSPAYRFPAPMLDGSRAVRLVRARAAELGVDPRRVGVWGFSAGAHLSGYLASRHTAGNPGAADPVERVSDRPDFAILSYGRFDLSDAVPRPAATPTAPGMETVMGATTAQIDVVAMMTADNSPAFLYSTSGDQTVDSRNSTAYYDAMKRLAVPAELHIFERGAHGTGLGDANANTPTPPPAEVAIWPTLLAHWMEQNGWMPAQP